MLQPPFFLNVIFNIIIIITIIIIIIIIIIVIIVIIITIIIIIITIRIIIIIIIMRISYLLQCGIKQRVGILSLVKLLARFLQQCLVHGGLLLLELR